MRHVMYNIIKRAILAVAGAGIAIFGAYLSIKAAESSWGLLEKIVIIIFFSTFAFVGILTAGYYIWEIRQILRKQDDRQKKII